MLLIIIIIILLLFLPLIILFSLDLILKINKKEYILNIIKLIFGLTPRFKGNFKFFYQKNDIDCGETTLKNYFEVKKFKYNDFYLNRLLSAKDILDIAKNNNIELLFLNSLTKEQYINLSNNNYITLMNINYILQRPYFFLTKIFFKYYIKNLKGYHWVLVLSHNKKHINILDPYFGWISISKKSFIESKDNFIIIDKKEVSDIAIKNKEFN